RVLAAYRSLARNGTPVGTRDQEPFDTNPAGGPRSAPALSRGGARVQEAARYHARDRGGRSRDSQAARERILQFCQAASGAAGRSGSERILERAARAVVAG